MNMRYIVDKDTGRFLYLGRDRQDLVDGGHVEVPASNVKPDGNFWVWDGTKWVEDKATKARSENIIKLQRTDSKMAMVVEDLISLLGNKTSLSQKSQDLITERETLRSKI